MIRPPSCRCPLPCHCYLKPYSWHPPSLSLLLHPLDLPLWSSMNRLSCLHWRWVRVLVPQASHKTRLSVLVWHWSEGTALYKMSAAPSDVHGSVEGEMVRRWCLSASRTMLTGETICALPMGRQYTRGHLGHYTDRGDKLSHSGKGGACRWLIRITLFIANALKLLHPSVPVGGLQVGGAARNAGLSTHAVCCDIKSPCCCCTCYAVLLSCRCCCAPHPAVAKAISSRFSRTAVYATFLKTANAFAALAFRCLHIGQHFKYRLLYYRYRRTDDGLQKTRHRRAIRKLLVYHAFPFPLFQRLSSMCQLSSPSSHDGRLKLVPIGRFSALRTEQKLTWPSFE